MVGIILASHGSFADGIFQSGQMIFGEQENVAHVTLMPSEGPDDIRAKMEEAVASFENQDEVLFLVDLWGGTPFNQANNLVEQHKDKWAIVAGMNLPMVIEAYASRFSMEKAQDIAAHLVEAGKDGVKVKPESWLARYSSICARMRASASFTVQSRSWAPAIVRWPPPPKGSRMTCTFSAPMLRAEILTPPFLATATSNTCLRALIRVCFMVRLRRPGRRRHSQRESLLFRMALRMTSFARI